jgi:chromosome segregation ATPase
MKNTKLFLYGLIALSAIGLSLIISQVVWAEGENVPSTVASKDETPDKGLHKKWKQGKHKGQNKDIAEDAQDIKQDKKDIAQDTADIKKETEELQYDTADIKADRQALKDALQSGEQTKIQEAKQKLHNDIEDIMQKAKDIKKDRKDRRQDIENFIRDKRDRRQDIRQDK